MPKSATLMVPSRSIMMFCGFMSRWTMPLECACSSALLIWTEKCSASFQPSAPFFCIYCMSVTPSMSSMTIYSTLLGVAHVVDGDDVRVESMATACASVWKRRRNSSSAASSSRSILTATERLQAVVRGLVHHGHAAGADYLLYFIPVVQGCAQILVHIGIHGCLQTFRGYLEMRLS